MREKGAGSFRKPRVRADGKLIYQLKIVHHCKPYVRSVEARNDSEARKKLAAFRAEIESGALAQKEAEAAALKAQPTLGEWCETYLAEYMRVDDGEYDSTRETYSATFKHLTDELRATKLADITDAALHSWLRSLRPSLSVNTVRLVRAAISSCLAKALDRKLIASNPTPKFSRLNIADAETPNARAKKGALSRGQIGLILAHADPITTLWVRIMGATGLRPGEATALTWGDVDFNKRILSVRHSAKRGRVRGQAVLGRTKNKSSIRDLPIGAALLAVLQEARQRDESLMRDLMGLTEGVAPLRPLIEPEMCIFYAGLATKEARNAPRTVRSLRDKFKKAVKAAGFHPKTLPHGMRHSALTAMIAGDGTRPGVSPADAARMAGHAKVSTTLDIYSHAIAANLDRGAELAGALIEPVMEAPVESITRTKEGS